MEDHLREEIKAKAMIMTDETAVRSVVRILFTRKESTVGEYTAAAAAHGSLSASAQ